MDGNNHIQNTSDNFEKQKKSVETSETLSNTYKNEYEIIKKSVLFDENYYLDNYPEVLEMELDPILHYLEYGAKKGYNPSKDFSTKKYYENYPDVENAGLNPLYHFLKNGQKEGRKAFSTCEYISKNNIDKDIVLDALNRKVSIIVPIFNAFEETSECIRSVLLNTGVDYELILIDDCSTDERIGSLLDSLEVLPFVRVIRNEVNQGFVKNVNKGICESDFDVVLLNSDTVVTPRWLSHLVVSAYSFDDVATVTPLSNASDICVEELGASVDQLSLNRNAYLVNKLSDYGYFSSPTGNGFCLFIKRAVIDDIGLFDEKFGVGYGEESDFTYRAVEAGWRNIRNDSVFVYHKRNASFGDDVRSELKVRNKEYLALKHPNIFDEWDAFVGDVRLTKSLDRIRSSVVGGDNAERILYVTDSTDGIANLDDQLSKLSSRYDVYILLLAVHDIHLYHYVDGILSVIKLWSVEEEWTLTNYLNIYFKVLYNVKIDLMYIRFFNIFYDPIVDYISSIVSLAAPLEIGVLYETTLYEDILKLVEENLNPVKELNDLIEDKKQELILNDKKIVVYTAIFDEKDYLKRPTVVNDNFDYICFTNNPNLKSDFWNIKLIENSNLAIEVLYNSIKLQPHKYLKEYDYSLWIDYTFDIIDDLKKFVGKFFKNNKFLALKQDNINTVFEEREFYSNLDDNSGQDSKIRINEYKLKGLFENGLISTNVLFRNHNDEEVIGLSNDWFEEVTKYNIKDSLSFNYISSSLDYLDESEIFSSMNQFFYDEDSYVSLLNNYTIIKNSPLFDKGYYIEKYPEIKRMEMNPILHYIVYGYKKDYNPSYSFSTRRYKKTYVDVANSGLNPLVHYINNGLIEERELFAVTDDILGDFDTLQSDEDVTTILNALNRKVSIIVPIFNAFEETSECIRSVLLNTGVDYELILIDDCSTDERIGSLLDSLEVLPFVRVIRNEVNQGFVKNVNKGICESDFDVVLLNSDTVVTPRWLSHLVVSAYSFDDVATVTPLSNASDICVEELGASVDQLSLNRNAYLVNKLSDYGYFSSPTGNGFCLFIKRAVIDDIGLFDEKFGVGYGEESDFTYRAVEAGWRNIRNDSVFVYHKRNASFGDDVRSELKVRNKEYLALKHPNIFDEWDAFVGDVRLTKSLDRIRSSVVGGDNAERILYVTDSTDGVPNLDERFDELSSKYNVYILVIESNMIYLYQNDNNITSLYKKWNIRRDWSAYVYLTLYFNILNNLKIDLIYVKYIRNFYQPALEYLSSFIQLIPFLEISVIYEATLTGNILDEVDTKLNPIKSLEDLISLKKDYLNFSDKKIVVYTAITGSYDEIITPQVIEEDFDYICFTDNPDLKSEFWDIRYMEELDLDGIRKARYYKLLPHKYLKEYDYSIWIDANFDIIGSLKQYITKYSKTNKFLAIKHDLRDCIYEEAETCIEMQKDSEDIINLQIEKYRQLDYPEHNGLIASGILFRDHHDDKVIKLCEDWFDEVTNYSRRDQLSFNYVCWRNNFKYDEAPLFYFKNEYFQRVKHTFNKYQELKYHKNQIRTILDSFEEKVSIVIPIYNALEETKQCIDSVINNTNVPYELLLINDCSTDDRILPLLDSYSKIENVKVINNEENMGFVRNVNLSFKKTSNDVVLLNSDTIVTHKWLQKLKISAYSSPDIATVTPVSNNAGAFSVPLINQENDINEELGLCGTANIIEKVISHNELYAPTANGYCMYIKRDAIYSVGLFDLAFGKGYGEENDFSMRLLNKQWKHIVDMSTYIYHKGSVSFSDEKEKLINKNRELLNEKYPNYKEEINAFINSKEYYDQRRKIRRILDSKKLQQYNKQRLLYVIHEGTGGTLHTSIELMKHVNEKYDVYVLTAGKSHLKLFRYYDYINNSESKSEAINDEEFKTNLYELAKWKIKDYTLKEPYNECFSRVYFNVLHNLKIDLIHIRHLIRHTFDLPKIAKTLGIPIILSFHDFYYICPSHCLIDDKHNYCAGHCTQYPDEPDEQCSVTSGLNVPLLKTFVYKWRDYVREMIEYCSEFVTTSKSAYDLYVEFYPELKEKPFDIIEHGRDLTTPSKIDNIESIDKPIKIVFPGHINYNKGGLLIKSIKELDKENNLEFHYMGNLREDFELDKVGIHHGYYNRSDFCKIIHKINPHYIGILSIWPETYCHTLTEAWSCGVPVLVINIGALGERVQKCGGGFFIENDAKKAFEKIIEISRNPDKYNKTTQEICNITFKSTKKMSEEYMEIYNKWLEG
ncbi:MAG: glycosyltransferase [Methanosphaera stadtmanae]|nr:glycosyltransferase [Methanosphaera stadtmanae]